MYPSYHGGFPPGGPPSSTEPTDLRHNTQLGHQGVDQLLLLGRGGVNPELLTGLLQHGHGQLAQGAVLRAFSQLVFWHLHFGLLLGSASGVSCRVIDGESVRSKE
ncbi:hypothetical protein EYF80_051014 [Liparis tanakae]|uniref:Uncharacterized protein n=1 Tax=Liparis tanakae TaxID=230148 RepID=A0A4Z2FD47_9TELE|nr:hypothetical protein EYF80_051014 [Liparis tanakae]